jgi:hypothetical protein
MIKVIDDPGISEIPAVRGEFNDTAWSLLGRERADRQGDHQRSCEPSDEKTVHDVSPFSHCEKYIIKG